VKASNRCQDKSFSVHSRQRHITLSLRCGEQKAQNPPHMKTSTLFVVLILLLAHFEPLHTAQAVSPPPDGGYPGGNTAEGASALFSLTTGTYNTAIGYLSLRSDAAGNFNTAIGAGTLLLNTADENTATGTAALLSNYRQLKYSQRFASASEQHRRRGQHGHRLSSAQSQRKRLLQHG
jgi:hypothetical protein